MFNGSTKRYDQLIPGDELKGVDGGKEILQREVKWILTHASKVTLSNGIIVQGASSDHYFMYDGGGFEKVFNLIKTDPLRSGADEPRRGAGSAG